MNRLSIVIPVYNEIETLHQLVHRLDQLLDPLSVRFKISTPQLEIIFVNDGSRDGSFEYLMSQTDAHPHFKLVNLAKNYGHQIAITAGITTATGNAVVIMDGDLQDPPEVILDLYDAFLKGYDVVYATRKKRLGESLFKRATAYLYAAHAYLSGLSSFHHVYLSFFLFKSK